MFSNPEKEIETIADNLSTFALKIVEFLDKIKDFWNDVLIPLFTATKE